MEVYTINVSTKTCFNKKHLFRKPLIEITSSYRKSIGKINGNFKIRHNILCKLNLKKNQILHIFLQRMFQIKS